MSDAHLDKSSTKQLLLVSGMDCASCVSHVEKAIRKLPGVDQVNVNLALGRAVVEFNPDIQKPDVIAKAVTDAGYPTQLGEAEHSAKQQQDHEDHQKQHANQWFWRGIVGLVLWLPVESAHWVMYFSSAHAGHVNWLTWVSLASSLIALVYVGSGFYTSAYKAARRLTTNMDTLIAMGATVAFGYSFGALLGHLLGYWQELPHLYFTEGTALLGLVSFGHWLESRARDKAGSAIRGLMHLAPTTALRLNDIPKPKKGLSLNILQTAPAKPIDEFTEVSVAMLGIGDRVLVRPGDRVPIDGVVVSGSSSIDESMLTGESVPVTRTISDEVFGGTINQDGALTVRVTRIGADTALAQIVKLVETAQNSKPPVQKLADQIAAIFVPAVLSIALITGIGWYLYGHFHGWEASQTWGAVAKAVCSVLIVACPCALGLAVPAALMVGTGRGAGMGILYRDISALENAEGIHTVILDKTGTLTLGKPTVTKVQTLADVSENDLIQIAASAERFSSHPLGIAIVAYAKSKQITLLTPDNFTNEPGVGVRATINGKPTFIGKDTTHAEQGTSILITQNDQPIGRMILSDTLKPDSAKAISNLHNMGLQTLLLTGDNENTAQQIAKQVGITNYRANIKPEGKADVVRELQKSGKVAMVGDGINDAPALAQADLGIAIGSGSDIAKETGGIVLVSGSTVGVSNAINLSRATMKCIRQNLFFAFIYNIIAIPLAATGLLSPIICAAAMALSDVTVIGNALRLRYKKL